MQLRGIAMRQIIIIFILLLSLAACSQEEASTGLPTRAQTVELGPRNFTTEGLSLPPTWTPPPVTAAEHLPPITGPDAAPEISAQASYVVQPGDTLGEIASLYGVTVSSLASANRIANIDVIEVGTVLIIPDN
jgi:LysM repeat protein